MKGEASGRIGANCLLAVTILQSQILDVTFLGCSFRLKAGPCTAGLRADAVICIGPASALKAERLRGMHT